MQLMFIGKTNDFCFNEKNISQYLFYRVGDNKIRFVYGEELVWLYLLLTIKYCM